jgi:nucleotide-binding universal stress UspA family protein
MVFSSKLILIHIGEKTQKKQDKLQKVIDQIKIKEKSYQIIWDQGNIEELILKHLKENVVDLFIMGALKKERFFKKYFISSISRNLMRSAKCSTMVLAQPKENPSHFKKIVVTGSDNPKTQITLKTAAYFAENDKVNEMHVIKELYLPGMSSVKADGSTSSEASDLEAKYVEQANKTCENYLKQLPELSKTKITTHIKIGQPGHSISNFAKECKADLLIVNSPDHQLGFFDRVFTHDIEHILSNLNSNLLIVHSRGF